MSESTSFSYVLLAFALAVGGGGAGAVLGHSHRRLCALMSLEAGTVGDSSLFEAQADWLKTTAAFNAAIKDLNVKGKAYENVNFNFPNGNDSDEKLLSK